MFSLRWPHEHFPRLAAFDPCTKTKECTPFRSYTHYLHISASKTLIQLSYTELQTTDSLMKSTLSFCLATLQHPPCIFLWQQSFFRRPTNISQGLFVVSIAPKQLKVLCKSVVTDSKFLYSNAPKASWVVSMIIHTIHNNPQSFRYTVDNCDCDNRAAKRCR